MREQQLIVICVAVLVLTVLLELVVDMHPHFYIERLLFFFGIVSALGCLILYKVAAIGRVFRGRGE